MAEVRAETTLSPEPQESSPKIWLITGCSSGFGRMFIPALLARGDKVIATARNPDALKDLTGDDNIKTMQLDVTAPQETLDQKVAEAIHQFGRIDVLVNNAGFIVSGIWEVATHEDAIRQFNTNFFGPLNLARAILPHMRTRRTGSIVFMGSIAAWFAIAGGGLYSSSKFALEGAVESLSKEIAPLGIETYLFILGSFRTDILTTRNRKSNASSTGIPEYDRVLDALSRRYEASNGNQPGDPKAAVERILDIVKRQGTMQGKTNMPLRIALGSDAVQLVRNECTKTLREIEEFEALSRSTDFPGVGKTVGYQ